MNELQVDRFREQVEARLGLVFVPGQQEQLKEVLQRRASRVGVDSYLEQLEGRYDAEEVRRLAAELTVGETLFFRHWQQMQAFLQVAVPARLKAREKSRRLSILSIGCASGEEPYSLAMLLQEHFGLSQWEVQILGVDVNPKALGEARRGLYSGWSLRETPEHSRLRWFVEKGQQFHLDQKILDSVQFEERNLNLENSELWMPSRWDIVFCRNMLMYFGMEKARILLERLARGLAEEAFLFLGPAENLRGISSHFGLRHHQDCFYYQLAPHRASRPLTSVAGGEKTPRSQPPRPAPGRLSALRNLLDREQDTQALELLQSWGNSPQNELWRASILVNRGQFQEAESLLDRLLLLPDTEAGAHFFLGLCRREAGEPVQARGYFERALRLDPKLAMASLYLGMLLRRLALPSLAGTYLKQAGSLLERETEERLLLFGGAFRRSAWLALAQTELGACRG